MEIFGHTTGMKVVRRTEVPKAGIHAPDGLVRIQHENTHLDFTVQAKTRITRATVAIEKAQQAEPIEDRILLTDYVTPPLADLMKEMGLFFMDLAGNAYINKPPIYVFVKGNKLTEELKPATIKRLFKTAGLKVVFALLDAPERVNLPYRQIVDMTDVALGTVDWIFRDLKEMGFLVDMGGRKRRMTNLLNLLKRWVEAYPDQLRPKLGVERFKADHPDWWQDADLMATGDDRNMETAGIIYDRYLTQPDR